VVFFLFFFFFFSSSFTSIFRLIFHFDLIKPVYGGGVLHSDRQRPVEGGVRLLRVRLPNRLFFKFVWETGMLASWPSCVATDGAKCVYLTFWRPKIWVLDVNFKMQLQRYIPGPSSSIITTPRQHFIFFNHQISVLMPPIRYGRQRKIQAIKYFRHFR
jgi:hypothetical protein